MVQPLKGLKTGIGARLEQPLRVVEWQVRPVKVHQRDLKKDSLKPFTL